MEVIAAIGWIIGLAALAGIGWGQQKLSEARELIERKSADAGSYKKQLGEAVQEGNATLRRVKERAETDKRFAHEPVVKDLLEVVDSFERALETLPDGPEADGVRLIHQQLVGTLARHGVERVPAVGAPFDPEQHEAIGTQPSDEHDENTVIQEWCGGYRLHDRLLRAAKVVTAVPAETEEVPLETDEAPLDTDDTPAEVDDTPVQADESPAEVDESPAEVDESPAEVDETPVVVDDAAPDASEVAEE